MRTRASILYQLPSQAYLYYVRSMLDFHAEILSYALARVGRIDPRPHVCERFDGLTIGLLNGWRP